MALNRNYRSKKHRKPQEYVLTESEHIGIRNDLTFMMLRRVQIFSVIVFLIHLTIVLFVVPGNMKIYQGQTLQAYISLFYCDITVTAVSFLFFILTSASFPKSSVGVSRLHRYIVFGYCFFLMMWAAVKTGYQQVFVGQISIYLVVLLAIGSGTLLSAKSSYFIYFLPYMVFVGGTLYFKKSIPLLQDNLINGSALTFVTWFLSRMLYNNTLGNLVKQKIIEHQKNDLQKEKNELKRSYDQIEDELSLARKIQDLQIPRTCPMPGVASLYKPMSQVGGDFFDYIVFRESNELGIFLSDVSGHGVPAAFITAMIKSYILQARNELRDPAELFRKLNDHLFGHTNENFITSFYGILNFNTKSFRYTNAGHCRPIILDPAGTRYIETPHIGFPLGIMNTNEIKKLNKDYSNSEIMLNGVNKLILYTDGITEALGNTAADQPFETVMINREMADHRGLPPSEFIDTIYKKLVSCHGRELFEDDICMICIDL